MKLVLEAHCGNFQMYVKKAPVDQMFEPFFAPYMAKKVNI